MDELGATWLLRTGDPYDHALARACAFFASTRKSVKAVIGPVFEGWILALADDETILVHNFLYGVSSDEILAVRAALEAGLDGRRCKRLLHVHSLLLLLDDGNVVDVVEKPGCGWTLQPVRGEVEDILETQFGVLFRLKDGQFFLERHALDSDAVLHR